MRRTLTILGLSAFAVAFVMMAPASVQAKPKKEEKKAAAPAPAPVPRADEKAVSELLGAYKWGMSVDDVLKVIEGQIAERVQPEIIKTTDVFVQNKLRRGIKEEVGRTKSTLLEFKGQKTGWDISILEGEFGHKNDESMMIYKDKDLAANRDQEKHFFFWKGKLWKVFVAVNMDAYKDKTFNDFRSAMESRFGKGAVRMKRSIDGVERIAWVHWKAGRTYLRAVDLTQFYGTFALAFSDENAETKLAATRQPSAVPRATAVEPPAKQPKVHDPNEDVIDRIVKEKDSGDTLK